MSDIVAEHGHLLSFLYAAPVGLVHAALDGRIETINAAAARFLLPLAPEARLDNLYAALQTAVPALAAEVASHPAGTVVDGRQLQITPPPRSRAKPLTLSLTVTRLVGDRLVVMHAGHVVEAAPTRQLFAAPRHPYTARLMSSTPGAGSSIHSLQPVPGQLPDLRRSDLPACRFAGRCTQADSRCHSHRPPLDAGATHAVACWHPLGATTPEMAHG